MREGEVLDEGALATTLRELFGDGGLGKRVRVGVANQRTVLRTLELPPVTDRKELAAAVRFQAQDQVPMPLEQRGARLPPARHRSTRPRVRASASCSSPPSATWSSGCSPPCAAPACAPEGIDLSAFALIRSLYRPDPEHAGRVLYLNVDGLTNLAIAEGTVCRFTRVVGGGLEAMASELAERRGIALTEARALLAAADLTVRPCAVPAEPVTTRPHRAARRSSDRTPTRRRDPEAASRPEASATPDAESRRTT